MKYIMKKEVNCCPTNKWCNTLWNRVVNKAKTQKYDRISDQIRCDSSEKWKPIDCEKLIDDYEQSVKFKVDESSESVKSNVNKHKQRRSSHSKHLECVNGVESETVVRVTTLDGKLVCLDKRRVEHL